MAKYYPIKYGRSTVRPLKREDAQNLMIMIQKKRDNAANIHKKKMYDRDYMLIKLGLNTAFRINDLLFLKVDDNLLKGYMYMRERKTRKEQYWELNPKLHKDLMNYINRNYLYKGEYLFQSRQGGENKPITSSNAWKRIKSYAKELGIKYNIGCHSLRKCFARTFYEDTKDLITLQKMLNHSSPQVTLIYICWDEDDQLNSRKDFYI